MDRFRIIDNNSVNSTFPRILNKSENLTQKQRIFGFLLKKIILVLYS